MVTTPEMKAVSSSNVESVGYDGESKELYVTFLNGSTYKYLEVPRSTFNNLLSAPSVGCYLNKHIKNRFAYEKV